MGAPTGAIIAAAAARRERQIINRLRESGAFSPDKAVSIKLQSPMGRTVMRRLMKDGAVTETHDQRYWLDEGGYQVYRKRRSGRIALALGTITVLIAVAVVFGLLSGRLR